MIFFYGRQWKPSLFMKYLDRPRCLFSKAVLDLWLTNSNGYHLGNREGCILGDKRHE